MKRIFSTILLFISVLALFANPVDEHQARSQALQFLQKHMKAGTRSGLDLKRAETGVTDTEDAAVYVFNHANGFVIISGDDALPDVLGYSDAGAYEKEKAPAQLKWLLQMYSQAAKAQTRLDVQIKRTAISPLIKSRWGQRIPFNYQCPIDESDPDKARSVTGCTATAIAQVMYYHRYPANYDWDKMKTVYDDESETDESAQAVSKLMADCGKAVDMEYSSTGSSSYNVYITGAFRNAFGYEPTVQARERIYMTNQEWEALLYEELSMKRPVLFTASSYSTEGRGGHTFIIDGYDTSADTGYFHVNWGWYGQSDGYYLIGVLDSELQGIGGTAFTSGYSCGQMAIVGIRPPKGEAEKTVLPYLFHLSNKYTDVTFTRTSSAQGFKDIELLAVVYNVDLPKVKRTFEMELALFKGGEKVQSIDVVTQEMAFSLDDYALLYTKKAEIGKGLAEGTYEIRMLSREKGKKNMVLANGGADVYIEAVIKGNTMTFIYHGLDGDLPEDRKYTVNKVTVSEDCRVGKKMTVTANITNHSQVNNTLIGLWGNLESEKPDSCQFITAVGCNLSPGETGDVVFNVVPQHKGTLRLYISTSIGDDDDKDDGIKLYTIPDIVVAEMSMVDVSMDVSFDIEHAVQQPKGWYTVESSVLKGTMKLTNTSQDAYDELIVAYLLESEEGKSFPYINNRVFSVKLEPNATTELPLYFDNLIDSYYYAILVLGVEKGTEKWLNLDADGYIPNNAVFKLLGATGIDSIQADAPDADVYDLRGVRVGKASELHHLPKGVYIINKKKVLNK